MRLEFVNKELGIAAIDSIEDLGEIQVSHLKMQYGQNANLDELAFFYMSDRDWIVINKSHPRYDFYLQIMIVYLALSPEGRNKAKEQAPENVIKRALYILDGVIKDRERIQKRWCEA